MVYGEVKVFKPNYLTQLPNWLPNPNLTTMYKAIIKIALNYNCQMNVNRVRYRVSEEIKLENSAFDF